MQPIHQFSDGDDWLKILTEQDRTAKENGSLVGRYIHHAVGSDGDVWYVIIAENARTVKVVLATGTGGDYYWSRWRKGRTIPKIQATSDLNLRDFLEKQPTVGELIKMGKHPPLNLGG